MIRPANPDDAKALAAIWNPIIRDSAITFNPTEKSAADICALLDDKARADLAFLVAEEGGVLLGFATYGQFRTGLGYRHSAEHTVILAPAARGKGLGRGLMAAIEEHAAKRGFHSMMAGVSSANPAGVSFHERLGYMRVGYLPEVGFKFGKWLDLTLLQKKLSVADKARPPA